MDRTIETPTSELEAVNAVLWACGLSEVSSLDSADVNADAEKARAEVRNASRTLQTRGWSFNREEDFPIDPDPSGEIILPLNTLKVRSVGPDASLRLVQRGQKLYDPVAHTFAIGATVRVDIVLGITFEDLPEYARWLITVRASRRYATKRLASPSAARLTHDDEKDALDTFEQAEAENDNQTMAHANPHVRRWRRR